MSFPSDAPALSFQRSAAQGEPEPSSSGPFTPSPAPSWRIATDPARPPQLYDALAPLVTDASGAGRRPGDATAEDETGGDPFQALVADIAIQRSRDDATPRGGPRGALLRAIAELAETHAVAADLACEKAAIDLPLDVPDPAATDSDAQPMLIVPDVIRTCRDRLAVHASDEDRRRIDVVATLFDHVLSDDRIATAVRNTLARLQLPVLRMALADESFFASRTHPTRRLIDRLTASAANWQGDTPSTRAGIAALERCVHTVIRGSFEDAGEHARLLEQFERAIVDIASAANAAQPPIHDAEDRDVLVIQTTIQISQLLAGIEVDRAVRFFLLDVWSRVLVEIACRESDAGRDALLARAKRLCFDLAWTAAPKTTSGERARLAGLLPTMIAAIREGLRLIDHPEAAEREFFADWTRVLLQAVRNSPGAPFRWTDTGHEGITIDAFAQRLRTGSFGPEPAVATAPARIAASAPGLRPADAATPSMLHDRSPVTASPTKTQAPASIVVEELKKGDWFELRANEHADEFVRVRLSWVSPLRSFYLLIGADSALTRSLDPDGIRSLVARGDLRRAQGRRGD